MDDADVVGVTSKASFRRKPISLSFGVMFYTFYFVVNFLPSRL